MWEKIKKILQKEGGKCIIIENNQPTYLITRIEDDQSDSETEKINRNIDEWKAKEEEAKEVKVEDLPF